MTTRRPPQNFLVQISLDSSFQFHYTELFTNLDASQLTVLNGDQIAWMLDPMIENRSLQIDFGIFNPFRIFHNVSLRGNGLVTGGTVNFPKSYTGNRILKYGVFLGNGFHDDPDVVPVESNLTLHNGALALAPNFKLKWTDATYTAIVVDPGQLVLSAGSAGKATVTWKWSVTSADPTPPFSLAFTSPPAGWQAKTDSTGTDPAITLSLPPGPITPTQFTITTSSGDGSTQILATGFLTVTA